MKKKLKKAVLITSIWLLPALSACGAPVDDPVDRFRPATETAAALDALAAGTIEALERMDKTATSAARTAQPTATQPPPTPTVTITLSPTMEFVEVEVSVDTNCRSGPNISFEYLGALLVGERTQIVARSEVPGYFIVVNPDRPGRTCWLWDRHATIIGNLANLPLLESPATPTPAPAAVAGWTFVDVNGNERRDSDESDDVVSSVALILRVGVCPGGIVAYSTTSDDSGRYLFPIVLAAEYCLTVDPSQSPLSPGQYSLSLGSGEALDEINFWTTP